MLNKREMNILIVEDNAIQALVIETQLNKIGYQNTLKVMNADKAAKSVEQFNPDLMLVDINLGSGESGIDFVSQNNPSGEIPVIFISGNSDEKHRKIAADLGAAGFLVKPIHFGDLRELIDGLPAQ